MSEWMGEVSKVNERDWGTKTIYSWQFKGTNLWFRCSENPDMEMGTCYRVTGETPNKITTIEIIEEETLKAAATEQRTTEVPPTSSPDYWRWKQLHDLDRQSYFDWRDARSDATRIVCAALDNDVLKMGNVGSGKKFDMLIGMIKETTIQLLREDESGTNN